MQLEIWLLAYLLVGVSYLLFCLALTGGKSPAFGAVVSVLAALVTVLFWPLVLGLHIYAFQQADVPRASRGEF